MYTRVSSSEIKTEMIEVLKDISNTTDYISRCEVVLNDPLAVQVLLQDLKELSDAYVNMLSGKEPWLELKEYKKRTREIYGRNI